MIKIFKQSNSDALTRSILEAGCHRFEMGESHVTTFANGELTVVLEESVRNKTIVIVAQPTNYTQIFELLATIDAARRASAKEIIGIIPCLPHSRQERRVDGLRTAISARLFADMLQTAGLDRLITMDVHTTAIEGFYNIPFDNIETVGMFIDMIKGITRSVPNTSIVVGENYMVVSPDFGGMKRAKKYAKRLDCDIAFISKERLKANEVAEMTLIGDVKDKTVLIFDDMIDTGGTLIKAAELLKKNGATKVFVFATHGIFSNDAKLKIIQSDAIGKVFVTDSLPTSLGYYHELYTLPIGKLFANLLYKFYENN